MDLCYDEPIVSETGDLYNRTTLAARCAESLVSIRSDHAFVIGLSGQWGLGKTSFLNLVKEQLERSSPNTPIVEFNPWLYSSHEQLIRDFFNQLETSLGITRGSKLGKALSQYSESIAGAGVTALSLAVPQIAALNKAIPFANKFEAFVINRVLKKMGASIGADDKTLVQLRDEIRNELEQRKENIVVMVDDVDRLDGAEVCLLFKLVNTVASFPRMTFLLSYDMEVVTKALSRVQDGDGAMYLEKIVQLPISLPPIPKYSVRSQLSERLDPYITSQQTFRVEGGERTRLLRVFETFVLKSIKTPRQLYRYLNQFEIATFTADGEICPTDIIGLVGLSLFYPTTMRWLVEHRDDVCSSGYASPRLGDAYYVQLNASLNDAISSDTRNTDEIRDALRYLFPKTGYLTDSLRSAGVIVSRGTGRVAHLDNFLHFLGDSEDLLVSRAVLYRLANNSDVDDLSARLVALDVLGQLDRFSEFVQEEKNRLSGSRKEVICSAILRSIGSLEQTDEEGFLSWSAVHRLSVLLADLLRGIGTCRADAIVIDSLPRLSIRDLVGLGWFLRDERLAQNDEQGVKCLSHDVYEQLASRYVEETVNNWRSILRMPHLRSTFLWRALDEDRDGGALSEVRRRYGDDIEMRILSAAAALSHWTSGSGDGYSRESITGAPYEPVLSVPVASQVKEYGGSDAYAELPDDVKERVAALYIMLSADETEDDSQRERRVTSDAARVMVEEWR